MFIRRTLLRGLVKLHCLEFFTDCTVFFLGFLLGSVGSEFKMGLHTHTHT